MFEVPGVITCELFLGRNLILLYRIGHAHGNLEVSLLCEGLFTFAVDLLILTFCNDLLSVWHKQAM